MNMVDKWEYTYTLVPLGDDGTPTDALAGVALSATPEGKGKSTWIPFSVTASSAGSLVWWRRKSREALTSAFKALSPEDLE